MRWILAGRLLDNLRRWTAIMSSMATKAAEARPGLLLI